MLRVAMGIPGLVALAALTMATQAAEEPKLDSFNTAIKKSVPAILAKLHEDKIENVGVLKFLVADSDGVLRDNVGRLNRTLADRLEVGLTLMLEDEKLGIIKGASDGVAQSGNRKANHRTAAGRQALFTIGTGVKTQYFTVPWKTPKPGEKLLPDAFLTGEARLSKDRRTMQVKVQMFKKANPEQVVTVAEFTCANDTGTLTDLGLTYTRGGVGDIQFKQESYPTAVREDPNALVWVRDDSAPLKLDSAPTPDDTGDQIRKKGEESLKLLEEAPVKLEIVYDGAVQSPRPDAGEKYSVNTLLGVQPPKERQQVLFRLKNTSSADTYGAVLRVNGRNTIYEEQQDPISCHKWILKPGAKVEVAGYLTNTGDSRKFDVASPEASVAEAVNYGDQAGTIDLILFRGGPKPEAATVKGEPRDQITVAIARGALVLRGEPLATDLRGFKSQLQRESDEATKKGARNGMIRPGDLIATPVEVVEFYPERTPVLSTSIRYYALPK